jgi:hypothetical protein
MENDNPLEPWVDLLMQVMNKKLQKLIPRRAGQVQNPSDAGRKFDCQCSRPVNPIKQQK